jgi:hypothetical protein
MSSTFKAICFFSISIGFVFTPEKASASVVESTRPQITGYCPPASLVTGRTYIYGSFLGEESGGWGPAEAKVAIADLQKAKKFLSIRVSKEPVTPSQAADIATGRLVLPDLGYINTVTCRYEGETPETTVTTNKTFRFNVCTVDESAGTYKCVYKKK